MSDTPETDFVSKSNDCDAAGFCNMMTHARRLERERDEAQKTLTNIHRWIERNHPDGFIDSLTHLQNLDRVIDNWYDRLDRLEVDACRFERERDEACEAGEAFSALAWKLEGELNELRKLNQLKEGAK